MQGQRVRQWLTWPFNDKSGFVLEGYSRSTDSTFFYIRQLGIGLDAGVCRGLMPHAVFLTHGRRRVLAGATRTTPRRCTGCAAAANPAM